MPSTVKNPLTGRNIQRGGRLHLALKAKGLMSGQASKKRTGSSKRTQKSRGTSTRKVYNPATKRFVLASGAVGKRIDVRGKPSKSMQRLSREAFMYGLDGRVFLQAQTHSASKRVRSAIQRSDTKKYRKRPSPPYSATLYSVGFQMEGNDGNTWVIRRDRAGRNSWKRI